MRGRARAARDWPLWLLSAAAFACLLWYFSLGHGRLDFADHARGRDFVNLWTAGRLIGEGRALEVFDPRAFMAAHHRLFSPALPFHFWSYPPPALLLAAPFALTPSYFVGLAAWTAAGWGLLAWVVLSSLRAAGEGDHEVVEGVTGPPRRVWIAPSVGFAATSPASQGRRGSPDLLLLLCPAVAVNIGLGQNGAVTAALLLGGLALLERRPFAAGVVLGLLAFKPQVALLLPVMVVAGRRWRTMAGAAVGAGALLLAATLAFGVESWRAFLEGSLPMQGAMLRGGRGPFLSMMPSAFASLRLLGLPWTTAMAAQLPFTALGAWLVWSAWRSPDADPAGRAAVLCAATFIATPQAFNYDLIPAAFAALVLWRSLERPRGGRGWAALLFDGALVLAAWSLPATMLLLGPAKAPVAPLVLAPLALRLAQRAGTLVPSRSARPSAAGELASQT